MQAKLRQDPPTWRLTASNPSAIGPLKSLHQFLREKRSDFALRLNAKPPSLLQDSKKLPDGTAMSYRLLSLPLYLAGQAR